MLLRKGFTVESFISGIACTIAGDSHAYQEEEDILRRAVEGNCIYLAGGYWRAIPIWDNTDLIGVQLVNPDRTVEECCSVERGIAILRHYVYQDRRS